MNSKIRDICTKRGICCPWKFMVHLRRRSSLKIAKMYGVTQRTARNWKRWQKEGTFKCETREGCQKREASIIDFEV